MYFVSNVKFHICITKIKLLTFNTIICKEMYRKYYSFKGNLKKKMAPNSKVTSMLPNEPDSAKNNNLILEKIL